MKSFPSHTKDVPLTASMGPNFPCRDPGIENPITAKLRLQLNFRQIDSYRLISIFAGFKAAVQSEAASTMTSGGASIRFCGPNPN